MISMEEDGGNFTIALVGPDSSSKDGLYRYWLVRDMFPLRLDIVAETYIKQSGLVPRTATEIVQAAMASAGNTPSGPLVAHSTQPAITQYEAPVTQPGTGSQSYGAHDIALIFMRLFN